METRWVVTPPARALSSSPLSRLAHVDRTFRIPEGQFYQIMPVPCGLGLYAATFKRIVLTAVLCFRSSPSPRATLWSVSDIIDRAARHHFRRLLAFTTSLHVCAHAVRGRTESANLGAADVRHHPGEHRPGDRAGGSYLHYRNCQTIVLALCVSAIRHRLS